MISKPNFKNHILSRLPEVEMRDLLPSLEPIELNERHQIASIGEKIAYLYFLESGVGSIFAVSPSRQKVQIAIFGKEGFGPAPLAASSAGSLHSVTVLWPGSAYRLAVDDLWSLLPKLARLNSVLNDFSLNLTAQISYSALSNAVHSIDERLARWLLMFHDRIAGDELTITHDDIAVMLSVRRPSVTTALHVLEGRGLIKSERKRLTIVNRLALEDFAKDAYGAQGDLGKSP